ncbi:MAG: sigma-54-dependent Fis family transcriptional regulator [Zetaproteobacteria bacterium CG12_big_fil_rev_8_21_14_0_65_55_1124]|nr:MAG: sigma-54-dependent Fis family transcriptional regulator [Zetaproteobacteria bacterium CG1_02_55_237]PIS19736.1 MAG: sigma-54-dependent Fis family transcriptional regulator [Zetaproteobacteria bacterium CG08_land_8_20_14_0_20_55_17]PIW43502.1 MAG: sigma-54-dependent Fis family transcriptional regulator [Zetaproteobacteria bacterium CG12_big_fil_rev_8_21_14_0_65_55_1124]PIY54132.1 MAG: sigma-54-dependent Fis family transcriptional regulator [Zetaproteobacteria bacterium CG_4_10_14_0_8_um_f
MTKRILVVDDEEAIRDSLQGLFEDEGYSVMCAASGEEAVARFRKHPAGCVLLDIWMPGIDGLETLSRLKSMDADVPVIMMSGHATIDTAVRATRQGAFDFVEKPLSSDRLLILVRNALEKRKLAIENQELKQQTVVPESQELIGSSAAIESVRKLIRQVAKTDAPVLILGEHGTGKAVAAQLLHQHSRRAQAPFVAVNSAGIADSRMDSELFGHEKGAFPGALHSQRGRFEMAQGGTLFFDELTDLAPSAQAKVLRVLQEHAVQRIGSPEPVPVDIRLIAACNADPEEAMRAGILREDIYYRLNVVSIRMPALRERPEDIPLLIEDLAAEQAEVLSGEPVHFTADAMAILQSCRWGGNVRELRNYVERCHILRQGEEISSADMPPQDQGGMRAEADISANFHNAREAFERSYLLYHLNKNDWNVSRTAEDIGMERSQLHRKLKSFGLKEGRS